MTDTTAQPWRKEEPSSLSAVVYLRPCGYHVLLSNPGRTVGQALRPVQLGKSCVPYKVDPLLETLSSAATALCLGLANICGGADEDCPNL